MGLREFDWRMCFTASSNSVSCDNISVKIIYRYTECLGLNLLGLIMLGGLKYIHLDHCYFNCNFKFKLLLKFEICASRFLRI